MARASALTQTLSKTLARGGPVRLTGLRGSAVAVVAAELVRAHGERPVLVLTSSSKRGDALLGDLR
ncbi:MAG: hypothetical protein MJE66_21950, partial [Proteobacteria bacterium]|nr:hypothetical protein [Pseudomonadota bacterium]